MKKIILLLMLFGMILVLPMSTVANTFSDVTNDVQKKTMQENTVHAKYDNIDIKDITITKENNVVSFSLSVSGKIEDLGNSDIENMVVYTIEIVTNKTSYIAMYTNKELVINGEDTSYNKNKDTLSFSFELNNKNEVVNKIEILTIFMKMETTLSIDYKFDELILENIKLNDDNQDNSDNINNGDNQDNSDNINNEDNNDGSIGNDEFVKDKSENDDRIYIFGSFVTIVCILGFLSIWHIIKQ